MDAILLLRAAIYLFLASELALFLFKRAKSGDTRTADRGSLRLLWIVIGASVGAAFFFARTGAFAIQAPRSWLIAASMLLILAGMAIRWSAILMLGRFFTVDVAIHSDHTVVDTGLYRFVRHPSYSGLLLTFAGLGLSFFNWPSFLALLLPITWVLLHRIRYEERALLEALGGRYADYCARTKRLVPGLI